MREVGIISSPCKRKNRKSFNDAKVKELIKGLVSIRLFFDISRMFYI